MENEQLPRRHRRSWRRRSDLAAGGGRRARCAGGGGSRGPPGDGPAPGDRQIQGDGRRDGVGRLASALDSSFAAPDDTFGVLRDLLGRPRGPPRPRPHGRRAAPGAGRRDAVDLAGRRAGCRRHSAAAATRSPAAPTSIPASTSRRRLRASRSTRRPTASSPAPARAANYGNLLVLDHGFGIVDPLRPPVAVRGLAGQSRPRAATSSATSAPPAARPAPTCTTKSWLNGRLTNPLRLLAAALTLAGLGSDVAPAASPTRRCRSPDPTRAAAVRCARRCPRYNRRIP